jgi:hypothetical protein
MSYYTLDNMTNYKFGGVAAIEGCTVPWFTGSKISELSQSITNNHDPHNTNFFEVLFESDGAYNIIDGLEYDGNTTYTFYIVKTDKNKLLGIVTQECYNPNTFKVVFEFEFIPEMIFFKTLHGTLNEILNPFLFQIPNDGPWDGDSYSIDQILDELRAQCVMILFEDPKHKAVSDNFKRLLFEKLKF